MRHFTIIELYGETLGIAVVWPKNQVTLISRGRNTWLFRGWGTVVFDESSLDGGSRGSPGGPPGTIEIYDANLQAAPKRGQSPTEAPLWLRIAAPQKANVHEGTRFDIEMPEELECIVLPRWAYDILAAGPNAAESIYGIAKHCDDLLDGWDGITPDISAIKTTIEQIASAQMESLNHLTIVREFQQRQVPKLQRLQREATSSETTP